MEKIWIDKDGNFIELKEDQLKELSAEQLAVYTADKNKNELNVSIKQITDKIEEAKGESVSKEDYEALKSDIQERLDGLNLAEESLKTIKEDLHKKHGELVDMLKSQGIKIKSLESQKVNLTGEKLVEFNSLSTQQKVKILLEKMMDTPEFKEWEEKGFKGVMRKMETKQIIGQNTNHTGAIFVTEPADTVRDRPRAQPNMRDYLMSSPTDEDKITFPQITSYADIYTLGTQMLSENEEVTDVTFSSNEITSNAVRLGVSMDVSERFFRGRSMTIINHVIAQLADAMMFKEDIQILHGDGANNNLQGIITDAREFNLADQTYSAGAIASVATYDNGTKALITFASNHGLISGDTLIIANATEATYNATHQEIILIDATKVVIDVAYVAEASTAAWTGTGRAYAYQSIEDANEWDVLVAAIGNLNAGLYNANMVFLNPQTKARIKLLKGTDGQYLGITYDSMGRMMIGDTMVVSMPTIPAGYFLIGDITPKSIEIKDYTSMRMQFLEDVTTKKSNSRVILVDEELHLVKYNPEWYFYGKFSTAITNITKP